MSAKSFAAPAIAGLVALPIAGYTTYYLMQEKLLSDALDVRKETVAPRPRPKALPEGGAVAAREEAESQSATDTLASEPDAVAPMQPAPPPVAIGRLSEQSASLDRSRGVAPAAPMAQFKSGAPAPVDMMPMPAENRDRLAEFDANPVKSTQ